MSDIEELRKNAVRVDMAQPQRHTVVLPKNNQQQEETDDRISINLSEIAPKEEPDPNIHESLAKDILEGPDSLMAKYIEEKTQEYNDRMATYEQEMEMKAEEEAEQEDKLSEETSEFGIESVYNEPVSMTQAPSNIKVESEDLSVLESEDMEEDEEEYETTNDLPDTEDSDKKADVDDIKKVEEVVETPDIDLDVASVENDVTFESSIVEEDDSANPVDQDEVLENLKALATERLKPVSRSLNISSFTVLKKPTANISSIKTEQVKAAKWVLPVQNSIVLMKEFLGSELESLREYSEDSSSVTSLYRKYKTIYDHIVSPKPATYEQWLKSTPYSDIDHYFFAVYIASFKGANYIPLDCKHKGCEKTFLTEDTDIMKMVKFNTNDAKNKFVELYQTEQTPAGKGIYSSEIVPLSDTIAIGFKDASIYSLFEIASMSQKDREKYSSIIEFIPYIDALYIIHQENQTLEPVGYKIYPDNANKTVKSKIKVFNDVLKNLSVDEFTPIRSYVRAITTRTEGISYIYPSVECPYCNTPTDEVPVSAEELVFTRYQLAALVNTSLK